jgi:shikimate 5-dehydrogenase
MKKLFFCMVNNTPANLRELINQGYIFPAWLPERNEAIWNKEGINERARIMASDRRDNLPNDLKYVDLSKLDKLEGLFVFLTAKDYGAASPKMWNSLFDNLGKNNTRAMFFVGDPNNAGIVLPALYSDPIVLGGGLGSGWKESFGYLSRSEPSDLLSVNSFVRDYSNRDLVGFNTDVPGLLLPLEDKLKEIGRPGLEGKTVVMFGAGGVGKEIARGFVRKGVSRIVMINRTIDKARSMAEDANGLRDGVAEYGGEDKIEDYLTRLGVDIAINVSKKGAEPLEKYSAFAVADVRAKDGVERNYQESLAVARKIAKINPNMVIYDINLPSSGIPRTLEVAKEAGLVNLVDGKGMVANQGVIAIRNVQKYGNNVFGRELSDDYVRNVFTEALK